MSSVGPAAKCDRAAASLITSTGTTPTSNGLSEVASLIRFGVVPKKISSLWPEVCSNFGLRPAHTAVMAPPARTLNSAAVAADDSIIPAKMPIAAKENVRMCPPQVDMN